MRGDLFNTWRHSFEEDSGGTQVYRTSDFRFPPARGRDALEFRADGTFVQTAPGRGDQRVAVPGHWQELSDGSLRLDFDDGDRPPLVVQIVLPQAGRLELRIAGPQRRK